MAMVPFEDVIPIENGDIPESVIYLTRILLKNLPKKPLLLVVPDSNCFLFPRLFLINLLVDPLDLLVDPLDLLE